MPSLFFSRSCLAPVFYALWEYNGFSGFLLTGKRGCGKNNDGGIQSNSRRQRTKKPTGNFLPQQQQILLQPPDKFVFTGAGCHANIVARINGFSVVSSVSPTARMGATQYAKTIIDFGFVFVDIDRVLLQMRYSWIVKPGTAAE